MKGLRLAVGFLTAIPVAAPDLQTGDLGRAAVWFPVVGLALGLLLALAHILFTRLFSPLLAAALVVTLWAALTGGLHLDGVADCCDGFLAPFPPERRLAIMRDPAIGAFGAGGLVLVLLLKTLALASLPAALSFFLLPLTASVARWLILPVARRPAARPGGMGASFAAGLTRSVFVRAALTPLALLAAVWLPLFPRQVAPPWFPALTLLAVALAHFAAWAVVSAARARLGGITGDVFGLTVELAELTVLLTFAAARLGL